MLSLVCFLWFSGLFESAVVVWCPRCFDMFVVD